MNFELLTEYTSGVPPSSITRLWVAGLISRLGVMPCPVETPYTRTLSCHVEKNEAEEAGWFAVVLYGPKAGGDMAHTVGDSHLAAENKCYRGGEKSECDERAANDLSDSRHTQQRKESGTAGPPKSQKLAAARGKETTNRRRCTGWHRPVAHS